MTRTEYVQKHNENILKARIKNAGRECRDMEDVLENLDVLAKESTRYGDEKTYWLDLNTKKMIAKAIDPHCRVVIPPNEIIRYKNTLAVTAYFYWSDGEEYAGRGFARKSLDNIVSGDFNAENIETEFEALVMGAATTRALTDAGIGLEFYTDGFDEIYTALEEKEAEEIIERKKKESDEMVPQVPSANERKAKKRTPKKETIQENTLPEELPFSLDESVMEEVNVNDEPTTPGYIVPEIDEEPASLCEDYSSISLEDAYNEVADIGQFEGQTLGTIYKTRPLNLIWLINSCSKVSDAAKVIVMADENLRNRM